MPELTIQGKKINRVNGATVQILHGDAKEAVQIPIMQFVIDIPLDYETMIAEWALAPHGPTRWKTVILKTQDRSRKTNHTWTLHKAYVHSYTGKRVSRGFAGQPTTRVTLWKWWYAVRLLHNNLDYDGKNILQVAPGEAEPRFGVICHRFLSIERARRFPAMDCRADNFAYPASPTRAVSPEKENDDA